MGVARRADPRSDSVGPRVAGAYVTKGSVTERSAAGLYPLRIESDHLANDARCARGGAQTPLVTADKRIGCVVLEDVGVTRFVVPAHDPVSASVARRAVIASLAEHRHTVPQASRARTRDHAALQRSAAAVAKCERRRERRPASRSSFARRAITKQGIRRDCSSDVTTPLVALPLLS